MRFRNRPRYRFVVVAVHVIRAVIFLLSATAVGIAAIPVLVMIDLLGGGTGWGLCPNGLEACENPYSTAAEIAVILTVALFLIVLAIRLLMKLVRKLQSQEDSYQVTQ